MSLADLHSYFTFLCELVKAVNAFSINMVSVEENVWKLRILKSIFHLTQSKKANGPNDYFVIIFILQLLVKKE